MSAESVESVRAAATDTVRAFFAVELGASTHEAALAAIAVLRDRDERRTVRCTRPESLHVTLRFLGDVAVARLGELVERVGKELAGVAPFELRLGGLMLFPSERRPRVVAVEALPAEPLAHAAGAVERGCVAAGFEPEPRELRGHLTIGRVKRAPRNVKRGWGPPPLDDVVLPDHEPTAVRDAVLFRSELLPYGARYTPLERVPFGG